jgi:hypothetical protein
MLAGQSAVALREVDLTAINLYTVSTATDHIVRSPQEPVNLYLVLLEKTDSDSAVPQLRQSACASSSEDWGRIERQALAEGDRPAQPFSGEEDPAPRSSACTSIPVGPPARSLYRPPRPPTPPTARRASRSSIRRTEEQLEYDVAKLIHKLSSAKKPVIGWLSSLPMQGDFDMQTGRPRSRGWSTARSSSCTPCAISSPRSPPSAMTSTCCARASEGSAAGGALRHRPVRAARWAHPGVVDPNSQADQSGSRSQQPMSQFAADKSSHLEPLLASWGLEFKADQVVGDLERGLTVSMREGEPPSQHIAILGFDCASMAKDVITARLDSINMATAGSLKPS